MADMVDYNEIYTEAEQYYGSLSSLNCPAISVVVHFPSKGFNHIVYRKCRTERDKWSQMMRFRLLKKAYQLIGLTTTLQEYESSIKEFLVKKHKNKILVKKLVQYWGLIAIVEDKKIKVVLRKVGNGNLHFWSVIPAWVTNKTRDGVYIKTMKGDPDTD